MPKRGPFESKGSKDLEPTLPAKIKTATRDPDLKLEALRNRAQCFENREDNQAKRLMMALNAKDFNTPIYQAMLGDDLPTFQAICEKEKLDPHACIKDALTLGAQHIGTWILETKKIDVCKLPEAQKYDIIARIAALENHDWLLSICEQMGYLNVNTDGQVQRFPRRAAVDRYSLYEVEAILQVALERREEQSKPSI